ncbi:MAG: hypothetical protein NZ697_06665 [Porticoccaceae bacterium]|nr:hypothetical protein [Porticoccaceae bacterium]
MDKERINPIVAERDDMIGRSPSGTKNDPSAGKDSSQSVSTGISTVWKSVVLIALFGCIAITSFGWQQYQSFVTLQERFDLLDSRLNNTDESVNQSGVAVQVNIGKHSEQLKKHWSEIRKLWGVSNDKNKGKIDKNAKDIAFLASKRNALEASLKNLQTTVEKDRKNSNAVSENYFGLSADMDTVNESLRSYLAALNKVQVALTKQERRLQNNVEAIASIDAFRRQINQKVLTLEQQAVNKPLSE